MTESVIKFVTHPYPVEIMQARRDHANITGQPLVERPWWFQDGEYQYHDLYACIGWPTEASEKGIGRPGYAAIVGVTRPPSLDKYEHYDPQDAKFRLLAETESTDVPTLLYECVKMRERFGFGIQPQLLTVWFGDPDRFYTTVALFNERLIRDARGDARVAILIAPTDDLYTPKIFDNYMRSLQSSLWAERKRLYLGVHTLLKNRMKQFTRDEPSVMAMGGLVHSLLGRVMWMDQVGSNVFSVEEA